MTTTETIILLALGLTCLTTVVGWVLTYRTQRAILDRLHDLQRDRASLQEKPSAARAEPQPIPPDALNGLQEIADWFDQGMKLALDASSIYQWPADSPKGSKYESLATSFAMSYRDWSTAKAKHLALAQPCDPLYPPPNAWNWGAQPLPGDLPQLIEAFRSEIGERLKELSDRSQARRLPRLDLFSLHQAGSMAVKRVRRHALAQAKQEAPQ